MKNLIPVVISNLLLVVFALTTPAFSGDTFSTFTFGEGGKAISFEMSQEEIVAWNKQLMKTSAVSTVSYQQPQKWVDTHETGEGGITIEFELSKEEIALAKAKAEEEARRDLSFQRSEIKVLSQKFELPESGLILEFPVSNETGEPMTFAEKDRAEGDS